VKTVYFDVKAGAGSAGFHKEAAPAVSLLVLFWDEFPTRAPLVRSLSVGYEGLTAVYGIVRCRVRTEQNIAPIRSTAAAVTIQTLVVVGLQARSDKGWLVNVSPVGGAPCDLTTTPSFPWPFWLKLCLTVIGRERFTFCEH
jgi:hypothetical protein